MVKNKLVVYTALFGDYDDLIEPPKGIQNCDFICFTDQDNISSDVWDIKLIKNNEISSSENRKYKMLPHIYLNEYEYSIYIDSNIQIKTDPTALIDTYLRSHNIAVPKHFERDCIYKEIEECVVNNKITLFEKKYMLEILFSDGYPKECGLGENNIILRRHNDSNVIRLMEAWWDFYSNGPKRDQLSLIYLAWKLNVSISLMKESSRNGNLYFRYKLHKNEKKLPILKRYFLYIRANRDSNLFFKFIYYIKKSLL
jgi:hypothetical protein